MKNIQNSKRIKMEDVIDVRMGINTTRNLQMHKIPLDFDDLVFSICTKQRTLDLKANKKESRDHWLQYIEARIKKREEMKRIYNIGLHSKREEFKESLVEIW